MSTTIESLLDTDELREQIIERAAVKVVSRWRPADDEEDQRTFDRDLETRVTAMFQEQVDSQLAERVEAAIAVALEAPFTPTDQYGSPRYGQEPMTLREVIGKRVEQQMKVPEIGHGRGLDRNDTALGKFIDEVVKKRVHDELWTQFVEVADAIVAGAAAQIKTDVDYLVKRRSHR